MLLNYSCRNHSFYFFSYDFLKLCLESTYDPMNDPTNPASPMYDPAMM